MSGSGPRSSRDRGSLDGRGPVDGSSAGPAKVSSFLGGPRHSSSVRRSPPRLCVGNDQHRPAPECARWRGVARVPRAGVAGKRSHGWRSAGGSERVEATKAEASVRRRDAGDPEAPFEPVPKKSSEPRTCGRFIGVARKENAPGPRSNARACPRIQPSFTAVRFGMARPLMCRVAFPPRADRCPLPSAVRRSVASWSCQWWGCCWPGCSPMSPSPRGSPRGGPPTSPGSMNSRWSRRSPPHVSRSRSPSSKRSPASPRAGSSSGIRSTARSVQRPSGPGSGMSSRPQASPPRSTAARRRSAVRRSGWRRCDQGACGRRRWSCSRRAGQ